MREIFDLLRYERRARVFFLALVQSALGTGAGYFALLLIAYDRFESPWAISLVLIADLIPAMLLGPIFGAAADRWSRKNCAVLGDVLRVVGFAGIALTDSYAAMVGFAVLAGTGTGLFTPAVLAALPSVVDSERRLPAASSLYGVVADLGFTVGPIAAAAILALSGPETLIWINAATFAMSSVLLASLRFGDTPGQAIEAPLRALIGEARDGLRLAIRMRAVRVVLLASGATFFCIGLFNVTELFFVTDDLDVSKAAFPVLVAIFGVGFIVGSVAGSRGGTVPELKRRFLGGLLMVGVAFVAMSLTSSFAAAAVTFALAGFGNGLALVYERLLIHAVVADSLVGRIFGVRDALSAWAFAIAFVAGGAVLEVDGARDVFQIAGGIAPREVILIAGAIGIVAWCGSTFALRRQWVGAGEDAEQSAVTEALAAQQRVGAAADAARRG
jgi:MFS family permease